MSSALCSCPNSESFAPKLKTPTANDYLLKTYNELERLRIKEILVVSCIDNSNLSALSILISTKKEGEVKTLVTSLVVFETSPLVL